MGPSAVYDRVQPHPSSAAAAAVAMTIPATATTTTTAGGLPAQFTPSLEDVTRTKQRMQIERQRAYEEQKRLEDEQNRQKELARLHQQQQQQQNSGLQLFPTFNTDYAPITRPNNPDPIPVVPTQPMPTDEFYRDDTQSIYDPVATDDSTYDYPLSHTHIPPTHTSDIVLPSPPVDSPITPNLPSLPSDSFPSPSSSLPTIDDESLEMRFQRLKNK